MRIFLDTNVLVAAFLTRGLCADVVEVTLEEHELVIGEPVTEEVRRVLLEKFRLPRHRVEGFITVLRERAAKTPPRELPAFNLVLRDPNDAPLVRAAIEGRADVLVTGDRDLLEADLPIRVLSPRELWQTLSYGLQPDTVHEP